MKAALEQTPSAWPASKRFEHDPSDTELTCLLGGSGTFKIVETDGMLRMRPQPIPVTGIMLSMVVGAVFFTGVIIVVAKAPGPQPPGAQIVLWGMAAFAWLLLIPFWWIVVVVVNWQIAQKDDFVRVDTGKRTLELCGEGRTLQAAEILAFTEVSRYCRQNRWDSWGRSLQTGVLVHADDSQIELHAVVDGKSRPPVADRLASIFAVPVRRVKLNKAESRALKDC
jgi:hypothetical protein